MRNKGEIYVGLDIGSTKTACIIGSLVEEDLDIIGIGSAPSRGIVKGEVINLDATCESIRKAVEDAQLMAGMKVSSVIVGIGGEHIRGSNSNGMIRLEREIVRDIDIDKVIDAASALPELKDREVIHLIPQRYQIDNKTPVKEPEGATGIRLDATIHVVSAGRDSYANLCKCVNDCGLRVERVVAEQVASAHSVLSRSEKEIGVAVLDIGGGTTDLAIYARGALVHTEVLALGGWHFTNDLSVGLRCSTEDAEVLKKEHAEAMVKYADPDQIVKVPTVRTWQPRHMALRKLCAITESRAKELFEIVESRIEASGFGSQIPAGIVITGGGSQLNHLPELAEMITKRNVRRGIPGEDIGGLIDMVDDPRYAAGVGLVLYGIHHNDFVERHSSRGKKGIGRFFEAVAEVFHRAF